MSPAEVTATRPRLFSRFTRAGLPTPAPSERQLELEFEEARRRGYWFTAEDRQLLAEHEERLAAEQRGDLLRRAGRGGATALLVTACVVPVLWPVAIVAGAKAFPKTARRVGIGLLAVTGAGVIVSGLAVVQLGRLLQDPEPTTPLLAPAPDRFERRVLSPDD